MTTTPSDGSVDPLLAQALISLAGILITAVITYLLSQRRYVFEKLFDRKLTYIEELYGKVVELELELKKYIALTGADMSDESIEKKREEISKLRKKFFVLQRSFWDKEIVLDESTVASLKEFIDISNITLAQLSVSLISQQQNDHGTSFNYWDKAYDTMSGKLAFAKENLKKEFRLINRLGT